MKFKLLCILLVMGLVFNFSCTKNENVLNGEKLKEWKNSVIKERVDKDKQFKTDLNSPMAGIARIYVFPNSEKFIDADNGKIEDKDEFSKNTMFSAKFVENKWKLDNLNENFKIIKGNLVENAIDKYVLIEIGRYSFSLYPADKRLTVIVFDKEREKLKHFKGLMYFEPNAKFYVKGKFEKLEKPEPFTVITTRNEEKTYYRYAFIHFKIDGKAIKLTAFKFNIDDKNNKDLFIPFRDLTSGEESYGAGKYLDLKEPTDNEIIVDFNLAYNPLCNYSNGYNCPLAPAENFVDYKIEAGEKTYPH